FGATLYRAIAGKPPDESTLRMSDDRMPSAKDVGSGRYRPGFLAAIDACLKVFPTEGPQSVAELRPMLRGDGSQPKGDAWPPAESQRAADRRPSSSATPSAQP